MHTSCTRCSLHLGARCRVPYRGSRNPIFLFVGIGPGDSEDAEGVSFRGPAGQKLFEIMLKAGLPEELCAWSNIVKCIPRDPGARSVRDPTDEEMDACCLAIEAEIANVNPAIIIPLGSVAVSYFMDAPTKISKVRGIRHMVELPTIRYRYLKMRMAIAAGTLDVSPQDTKYLGFSTKERTRALRNAVRRGYEDVVTKARVLFPTYHPASILRGYQEAEFSMLADMNYLAQKTQESESPGDYKMVGTIPELIELTDKLCYDYRNGKFRFLVYDIEATSLDPYDMSQYITTMGFTDGPGHAWVVPYDHHESPFKGDELARRAVREHMSKMLQTIPIVGHNLKYDFIFSRLRKILVGRIHDDTLLMARSLFNDQGQHDLETLTSKYTDLVLHKTTLKEVQNLLPKDEKYNTDNYDLDIIVEYNGGDCDGNHRLYTVLENKLHQAGVYEAHMDLPARATIPVAEMEVNGCPLDWDLIEVLDRDMSEEIKSGYDELESLGVLQLVEQFSGRPLKVNSSEQVGLLLYDILDMKPTKFGKIRKNGKHQGQSLPSVDKHVLQDLLEVANDTVQRLANNPGALGSNEYEMAILRYRTVKTIQELKAVSKLHGDYVKSLPKKASKDGFVHTNYGIRVEATGRYNSTKPSLQVIPWHSKIKRMFISRFFNGLIVSADESQMELRMFAADSGDKGLIQAFIDDKDLHRYIAAAVLGVPEDQVPTEDRRRIKTVNFGLLYGRGDNSIAAQEGISKDRAAQIRADIFARFPKVAQYIKETHEFVKQHGYVKYINGFIRGLPWYSISESYLAKALRQGVNSRIQGPASDMVAQAMIIAYNRIKALKMYSKLWHYVHDSLGFDVPPGELFFLLILLGKAMNTDLRKRYPFLTVPMRVDYEVGPSWGELVEAKIESTQERIVEFDGKEEYFKKVLGTFEAWNDKPVVLSYDTKTKQEPAVIRSLMKSSGEMIDYIHVTSRVQFPPYRRVEKPSYKFEGFTLFEPDEALLV